MRRLWEKLSPLQLAQIILGCVFVIWNFFLFHHTPLRSDSDVAQYKMVATWSLLSRDFWLDWRPTITPLIFKLFNNHDPSIARFHLLVGILSWLILALGVNSWLTRPWVKLGGFAACLFLGMGTDYILPYRMVQTEAIAYSLFTLICGVWLLAMRYIYLHPDLTRRQQVFWGLGLWFITSIWTLSRYPNSFVLLGMVAVMGFCWLVFWRQTRAWRYILPIVMVGSCLTFYFKSYPVSRSDYWKQGLMNAIAEKVLPYPERREFLVARGMPSGEEALQFAGYVPARYLTEWEPIFEPWMVSKGRGAYYVEYVTLHPLPRLQELADNWEKILNPNIMQWVNSRRDNSFEIAHWQKRVRYLFYDPSALGYLLWGIPALLLLGGVVYQQKRLAWQFIPPLTTLALTLPLALLVWFGDAYYERVFVGVAQHLKLGVLLISLFALDLFQPQPIVGEGWRKIVPTLRAYLLPVLIIGLGLVEFSFGFGLIRNNIIYPISATLAPESNIFRYWSVSDTEYRVFQTVPIGETVMNLQQQTVEGEKYYREYLIHWSENGEWGELRNDINPPDGVELAWRNTPRPYGNGVSPQGPVFGGFPFEPDLAVPLRQWQKTRLPANLAAAGIHYLLVDSEIFAILLPYQSRAIRNSSLYEQVDSWQADGSEQILYRVTESAWNWDDPLEIGDTFGLSADQFAAYQTYEFDLLPEDAVIFNPATGDIFSREAEIQYLANTLRYAPPLDNHLGYFWELLTLFERMVLQSDFSAEEQALLTEWRNTKEAGILQELGIEYVFFEYAWMSWLNEAEIQLFADITQYELVEEWRGETARIYRLYRVVGTDEP